MGCNGCFVVSDVRLSIFRVKLCSGVEVNTANRSFFAAKRCFVEKTIFGTSSESRALSGAAFRSRGFREARLDRIKNSRDISSPSTIYQRAKGT